MLTVKFEEEEKNAIILSICGIKLSAILVGWKDGMLDKMKYVNS